MVKQDNCNFTMSFSRKINGAENSFKGEVLFIDNDQQLAELIHNSGLAKHAVVPNYSPIQQALRE